MDSTHVSISCQNHLLLINPVTLGNYSQRLQSGLVERKAIKKFSASSACRMRRYLRTCRAEYNVFITLTYPYKFPLDGAESKEHLRRFMQELKRYVKRNDIGQVEGYSEFSAFWFLEFQERGAIHYHIFANHFIDKDWIARTWYRIVNTEDPRHLHAGTSVEKIKAGRSGACAYASKYAAKSEQKTVPDFLANVGRFWGVCGDRICMAAATIVKANKDNAPRVEAKLKVLRMLIEMYIKNGQIVKVDTQKHQCSIYFLKSFQAKDDINRKVFMLEMANACEKVPPTYKLPQYEVRNDDFEVL